MVLSVSVMLNGPGELQSVIVCSNRIVHQRFASFDLTRAIHAGAKRLHERQNHR
jgi:hypothetical protein